MFNFSNEQIERYSRHIILKEVGGMGQTKLLESKVRAHRCGRAWFSCRSLSRLQQGLAQSALLMTMSLISAICNAKSCTARVTSVSRKRNTAEAQYRRDESRCQGGSLQ